MSRRGCGDLTLRRGDVGGIVSILQGPSAALASGATYSNSQVDAASTKSSWPKCFLRWLQENVQSKILVKLSLPFLDKNGCGCGCLRVWGCGSALRLLKEVPGKWGSVNSAATIRGSASPLGLSVF